MVNQAPDQEQAPAKGKNRNLIVALWALVGIFLIGMFAYSRLTKPSNPCPQAVATPNQDDMGGSFEAVIADASGSLIEVSDQELITKPSLLYFGYTYCPDICPLDTARNAEAVDILSDQGLEVTPIFITVDPSRDTPEHMRDFTEYLHEDMIGVSGTRAQIENITRLYRVYWDDSEREESPQDYLVNHSSMSYLVTPTDGLVAIYSRAQSAPEIAENIQCQLSYLDEG